MKTNLAALLVGIGLTAGFAGHASAETVACPAGTSGHKTAFGVTVCTAEMPIIAPVSGALQLALPDMSFDATCKAHVASRDLPTSNCNDGRQGLLWAVYYRDGARKGYWPIARLN